MVRRGGRRLTLGGVCLVRMGCPGLSAEDGEPVSALRQVPWQLTASVAEGREAGAVSPCCLIRIALVGVLQM